ncbi:MAG: ATP-binding protein [Verrucomicrobiota bacterium]
MKVLAEIIPAEGEFTREQIEAVRAEVAEKDRREREEFDRQRWLAICPAIYDDALDFGKLSPRNHAKIRSIAAWERFPRSLFICGPTGQGKTRVAWAALKRQWQAGKGIMAKSSFQFSNDALAVTTDAERTRGITSRYVSADIVLIDDLGKRLPASAQQWLFEVIERRCSERKAMVITSNETVSSLGASLGDITMAEPLARRVKEFFEVEVLQ